MGFRELCWGLCKNEKSGMCGEKKVYRIYEGEAEDLRKEVVPHF
jgi:hypothetical protein